MPENAMQACSHPQFIVFQVRGEVHSLHVDPEVARSMATMSRDWRLDLGRFRVYPHEMPQRVRHAMHAMIG